MSKHDNPGGTASVQPANLDAERAVLGWVMLNNTAPASLKPDDFYLDANREIYRHQVALVQKRQSTDLITLNDAIKASGKLSRIGGTAYLASLTDGLPPTCKVEHWARIVKDRSLRRAAIAVAEKVIACAVDTTAPVEHVATVAQEQFQNLSTVSAESEKRITRLDQIPDPMSLESSSLGRIVEPFDEGTVNLVTGEPGIGKSLIALRLTISIAMGGDFLGRPCEQNVCLYLDAENPLRLTQSRVRLMAGGSVPGLHIWGTWLDDLPMLGDPRLLDWAARHRPVIVFDTLLRFHQADENNASEMRAVMRELRRLAESGACVIVLHHRAKAEGSKYRGSSDILAAVDTACTITKDAESGLLTWDVYKNRGGAPEKLTLRPDFEKGTFELAESPAATQRRDDVATLAEIIAAHPGISQNQLISEAGIGRTTGNRLLRAQDGKAWSHQDGPRGSKLYFPLT